MNLKRFPVTLTAIVVLWGLRVAFGFDTDRLRDVLGFGVEKQSAWWTVATSALTVGTWAGALLTTLTLLTFGMSAERLLGSRRFLGVAALAHIGGLGFGTLGAWLMSHIGMYWGGELEPARVLSPLVWIFGATTYASALMPTLWRRRVRADVLVLTVTLILYAGVLADYAFFAAAVLGLLAGEMRRGRKFEMPKVSVRESRILLAIVFFTVFAGPLVSGMNPDSSGPFSDVSYFVLPQMSSDQVAWLCENDPESEACIHAMWQLRSSGIGPWIANLMPIAVSVMITSGLMRGRRLAYRFALLSCGLAVLAIAFELNRFEAAEFWLLCYVCLPWLLCSLLLLLARKQFQVKLERTHRRRFYAGVFSWWLLTAAAWVLLGKLVFPVTVDALIQALPLRYVPPMIAKFFTFDVLPVSPTSWVLTEWTGITFWAGFIVLFARVLIGAPDPGAAHDRARAREILQRTSGDHLAWMTLWPGNSFWFGEEGYVAYRVHNGIAVTVGEPVGQDRTQLADAFERHIYAQGFQVAWYSVRTGFAESRGDWHQVPVASESVIDVREPQEFKGKKFQDIRTARNRATKEGIHCEWTTWSECSFAVRGQIAAISEEWVSDKALPEMGFTLGNLSSLDDPAVRLMLAIGDDGTVHGITSWLPAYENGVHVGWVLDFMRRHRDGFRPVVEYLIASTLIRAHEDGLAWVSLSGAPLAVEGTGLLGQVLERVGRTLEPLYGFRSLAAFKKKFDPDHESWLLLYRDELALPAIGMAVSKCYVPELGPSLRKLAVPALGRGKGASSA